MFYGCVIFSKGAGLRDFSKLPGLLLELAGGLDCRRHPVLGGATAATATTVFKSDSGTQPFFSAGYKYCRPNALRTWLSFEA